MAEPKTRPTDASVDAYLDAIEDPQRRADCREVAALMERISGDKPRMWGTGMVGFGTKYYPGANNRGNDWFITGFASRKEALTLYVMHGPEWQRELMSKLGPHRTGKSCLYIKRLSDIDEKVLEQLVEASVRESRPA